MPVTTQQYNRLIASATQDILNRERIEMFGFNQYGQSNIDSLNPIDNITMSEDMHKLWLNNPLAFRYIETFNHFVSGDGLVYKAEEEEVQQVLDNFWKHPLNKWESAFQSRMKGLSLNGEMILKPEITEFAGKVKVSNINPGRIKEVFKIKGDDETIVAISLNNDDKPLKIIQWIETEDGGKYEGDIFFFQINKTPFQTRGLADPYFWRDWLKLYDKNLYANAKRSGLLLSFIWDVKMIGAEKSQLVAKEQQIANKPPQPGSVRIHNEKEEWKAEAPTLNAKDIKTLNDLIKSQNIAGSGMPEWFYGTGEGPSSLATAKIMATPFFKSIKARKDVVKHEFTDIFKYVIWQAEQKKIFTKKDIDKTFTIISSEPDPDKAAGLAEALSKFAQSVLTLQANGLIATEEAKQIVNLLTSQMGVEIDMQGDETQNEKTMQAAHKFLTAYNTIAKKKDKKRV